MAVNGVVISVNIDGIIALPVKLAAVKPQFSPTGGKMCSVSIGGQMLPAGGNHPQTLDENIFCPLSRDAHSGSAVYRQIAKHCVFRIFNENNGAGMKGMTQIQLISDGIFHFGAAVKPDVKRIGEVHFAEGGGRVETIC